ncbi:unnamed protein product, partial [marine sediment metagenome]
MNQLNYASFSCEGCNLIFNNGLQGYYGPGNIIEKLGEIEKLSDVEKMFAAIDEMA